MRPPWKQPPTTIPAEKRGGDFGEGLLALVVGMAIGAVLLVMAR